MADTPRERRISSTVTQKNMGNAPVHYLSLIHI